MDFFPAKKNDKKRSEVLRVLIDSRDRDPSVYPTANNFRVRLAEPIKNVKSLRLIYARVPLIAGSAHREAVITIRGISGTPSGELQNIDTAWGFPTGVVGVVPLVPAVPGGLEAFYETEEYKITYPSEQCLQQLFELHVQVYCWGGGATPSGWGGANVPSVLYPLAAESVAVPPTPLRNITLCIEVERTAYSLM